MQFISVCYPDGDGFKMSVMSDKPNAQGKKCHAFETHAPIVPAKYHLKEKIKSIFI
jgi:hypothetical protein